MDVLQGLLHGTRQTGRDQGTQPAVLLARAERRRVAAEEERLLKLRRLVAFEDRKARPVDPAELFLGFCFASFEVHRGGRGNFRVCRGGCMMSSPLSLLTSF